MKISYSVKGVGVLKTQLKKQDIIAKKASNEMVLAEAEAIMAESLLEVPRVTGTLANSAYIEQNGLGQVTFGYGKSEGANPKNDTDVEEYMVAVHERLDIKHPNGKAKFLEDPVRRHAEKIIESLTSKMRQFYSG